MAALTTNQGLQRIGINFSQATAYSASRYLRTMAWDDNSGALASGHTALDDRGVISNLFDQALDGTPTRSGETITHDSTIPTGSGNFSIRTVTEHDDTAANVTASSDTLMGGVDGVRFDKTSDISLLTRLNNTYSE